MWQLCNAILANTAETVLIVGLVNYLRITCANGAAVYLKFNWEVGDTEVSATNFDVAISDDIGSFVEIMRKAPTFPTFLNVRVISAGAGSIAFWGW